MAHTTDGNSFKCLEEYWKKIELSQQIEVRIIAEYITPVVVSAKKS